MADIKPEFLINPSFRLSTRYLSVAWHQVDTATVEAESLMPVAGRQVVFCGKKAEVIVQYSPGRADLIYHPLTRFDSTTVQNNLRRIIGDIITLRANEILPARVKYWEDLKGIHGKGVRIKKMRKNILGCCTHDNEIHLPPFLVIFKEEWMDGVILHEMAHYIHKHHRKPFWDFLSQLLGTDSRKAKVKDDIALSPYFDYYCYLTK